MPSRFEKNPREAVHFHFLGLVLSRGARNRIKGRKGGPFTVFGTGPGTRWPEEAETEGQRGWNEPETAGTGDFEFPAVARAFEQRKWKLSLSLSLLLLLFYTCSSVLSTARAAIAAGTCISKKVDGSLETLRGGMHLIFFQQPLSLLSTTGRGIVLTNKRSTASRVSYSPWNLRENFPVDFFICNAMDAGRWIFGDRDRERERQTDRQMMVVVFIKISRQFCEKVLHTVETI